MKYLCLAYGNEKDWQRLDKRQRVFPRGPLGPPRRERSPHRHVHHSLRASTHEYSAYNVDNLGYARTYRMTERDGVWSLTGPRERATIRFTDDGAKMKTHWEVRRDGERWAPLCDLIGTRV